MIKIHLEEDILSREFGIWIMDESQNGIRKIASPMKLEFKPMDRSIRNEPTLSFHDSEGFAFLTELSKSLIAAGFRDPAQDNSAEIRTLKNHLEDMRTLVFKHKVENK